MQKSTLIRFSTQAMLFTCVFVTLSIFRVRDIADKSLDLQVLVKLGVWALGLALAIALAGFWIRKIFRIDNILQPVLLVLVFASCFYAPNFSYSLASAFSLAAVLFLLLLSSEVLGRRQVLRLIICASTLVAALSILVYFISPDFGRMKMWTSAGLVPGSRLSGITGTANAIGYISAFTLLLLYYYRLWLPQKIFLTYWLFVATNVVALGMSQSRTSIVALVLAIALAGLVRASTARLAMLFLAICTGIIFFAVIDFDLLFSLLSRSGDVSEITTGTGRTRIWTTAIDLISQRPVFGWGYASSNVLLPAASGDVGHTATHAHNAFLQIALSTGLVGLFVFCALIVIKTYYAVRSGERLNTALIFFMLIGGLTEPIAFYGVASATALVLATILALNYKDPDETDNSAYQQRLP